MTQGVTINHAWPKSKRQLKEAVSQTPEQVRVIATSMFGNEFHGCIVDMPKDKKAVFAGPDFQYKRDWYGTIKWNATHTKLIVE